MHIYDTSWEPLGVQRSYTGTKPPQGHHSQYLGSSQVMTPGLTLSGLQPHLPSLAKVAETWNDVCPFIETFINPTSDLCITRKCSACTEMTGIIPHVVQETWYKTLLNPRGLRSQGMSIYRVLQTKVSYQVYEDDAFFWNPVLF